METKSVRLPNGVTISITIRQADANPLDREEDTNKGIDYDALVMQLLEDGKFIEALANRLGIEPLKAHVLETLARLGDTSGGKDSSDSEPPPRSRINGYVIPSEGGAYLFSAADIYGQVWGMETRNYSPLVRAGVDPEDALYMTEKELLSGRYRLFGTTALAELMAKRRPLHYRGLHIPSDHQYEQAVRLLKQFREADETAMFTYDLAGNQTVISGQASFRAIVEIMIRNDIRCREFMVDPQYPDNASEES